MSQALFLLDLGRSPGPLLLVVALPLSLSRELPGPESVLHVELRLDPLAVCPASFPLGTPQAPSCVLGDLPRAPHGTKGISGASKRVNAKPSTVTPYILPVLASAYSKFH